jgi:riboflavin synthase
VDGVGRIHSIKPDGGSLRMVLEAPAEMARMIAPKGSIAVDGISLTVNEVEGARFGVNIIPITQAATNLGQAREGDRVNLEIDLIARYVARLLAPAQ